MFLKESVSFKSILDLNRGTGPGFDLLRILLSVAIFYGHALWIAGGIVPVTAPSATHSDLVATLVVQGWEGPKRPFHIALVPMFFALSGFLVTGSAVRLRSLRTFLANRALRIAPALAVELSLSAFVLGPICTALPLSAYFSDTRFFDYFGNMFGWISFLLPGVFEDNPVKGIVNINLWTLPAEFDCYAVIAGLMLLGLLYRRVMLTGLMIAATIVLGALNIFTDFAVTAQAYPLHVMTYYFFVGVLMFQWRERIPFNYVLFGISAVLSYVLLSFHHTIYIAPIFVTYCTLFMGLMSIPKIKIISSGDYSYGIYLYGFPITQAIIQFVPSLRGHGWEVLALSGTLTIMFAYVSWHLIEKPTLALKRKLPQRWFPTQPRVQQSSTA